MKVDLLEILKRKRATSDIDSKIRKLCWLLTKY